MSSWPTDPLHIARDGGPADPEQTLRQFIQDHGIKVLNVAGPRASKEAGVYGFAKNVLAGACRAWQT